MKGEGENMEKSFAKEMPKLGFGLMRLPKEDGKIDVEQTKVMVDMFLEAGMKYFDTAYVYTGSEEATRKALVERYPRDSYFLTSKLNAGSWAAANEAEAKKQFEISLERLGTDYLDFYLLHALSKNNVQFYEDYGIWDYVRKLKEEGKIRHYGFSFHDTPELLEEILEKHPDAEFVQLQLNYADWDAPAVQSRRCYEVCVKHNKPVVVMEPVKGGTLAAPPQVVADHFKAADPDASAASWAVRFAASLENVMVVLSGMSNIEQMADNLSYMRNFRPLNGEEQQVIKNAQDALASIPSIPCTECRYCVKGCPMKIQIPDIFSAVNRNTIYSQFERAKKEYESACRDDHSPAGACIKCGMCEDACPQHLPIRDLLEEAAALFES